MSCLNILTIEREQCIGNSLSLINDNFTELQNGICANRVEIDALESEAADRLAQINAITNIAVPGSAKAWISFKGSNASEIFPTIYSSLNIESVERVPTSTGIYEQGIFALTFIDNLFTTGNYAVVGTSSFALNGSPTWLQIQKHTPTQLTITVVDSTGTKINPDRVSLTIF